MAVAAQQGTRLLTETFTGATADPGFRGYGSACLTGAPPAAAVPAGPHALSGCQINPPPVTQGAPAGPVPPPGGAPHGYLQLTDAGNHQAGAVLYNEPIPAAHGLQVTFEQWQYGSTAGALPADGISFFLVNGDTDLQEPGAFGGSLGYAEG